MQPNDEPADGRLRVALTSCVVAGCLGRIGPDMPTCARHWYALGADLRTRIKLALAAHDQDALAAAWAEARAFWRAYA